MTVNCKRLRQFLCVFLCFFLLFAASCTPDEENLPGDDGVHSGDSSVGEAETPSGKAFTIALYAGEEINPYTSVSVANRNLISLCFDGLISLDAAYTASPRLADYSFQDSGNVITFQIRDGAVFSDGSPVTAADCDYSFRQAAEKDSIFASLFSTYISKWRQVSDSVFEVTLASSNPYHINLFTIPIVKKGSSHDWIGSGRYRFSADETGARCLEHYENPLYAESFGIETIRLSELENANGIYYNFNYGVLHAAYADLSEGISHYKGNIELVSFPTSTFVFAAVNFKKDYFRSADAVRGISYCINRTEMSDRLFGNVCDIVWQPFHPSWNKIAVGELNRDIYSTVIANDYFAKAGYKLSGTSRLWGRDQISLKIVCNNEDITKVEAAKYIASSLKSMGFSAEVVQYNWENYKKAVASGDFDIYIGKVALPANMDLSFLFQTEILNSGKSISPAFGEALSSFYRGEIDAREMAAAFSEEMPFIPLYYTRGALAVSRLVSGDFTPSESDAFHGIENWTMK